MGRLPSTLWLRCESKKFERRAALTPTTTKKLVDAGFKVFVERDEQRIFDDEEYEKAGAELVEKHSWTNALISTPIIGLKELPVSEDLISHAHIHFAHCYKRQAGWKDILLRFGEGGGTIYDLEFLTDEDGRRVAAFGYHAGFAGAGAGLLAFSAQKEGKLLGELVPYPNENAMVTDVKEKLTLLKESKSPTVLVMGALGRCGRGAVDFFKKIGIPDENILKWDMAETAKGGPFSEILNVDIFVNCIYLSSKIPHFITTNTINDAGPDRRLSIIVDVSCDTTNPFNPIPVYTVNTTFSSPTVSVPVKEGNPALSVISIDHLPTLLPREASDQFSNDLLPSLLQLPVRHESRVWLEAKALFKQKLHEARVET